MDRAQIIEDLKDYLKESINKNYPVTPTEILRLIERLEEWYE